MEKIIDITGTELTPSPKGEDDKSILMKNISMKSLMNQQVEEQFSQEQM